MTVSRVRQRPTTWIIAASALTLVVLLAVWGALAHARAQGTLAPSNGTSAIRNPGLRVGQSFDFGVAIANTSADTTLTLRSVSLPNGTPAHVHLQHVVYSTIGLLGDHGWPVNSDDGPVKPTVPLDGARVAPGSKPIVVLVLMADQPGVYVIGPVTVHADVPGPLGISIPIEQTLTQFAVLCPGATESACHAAPVPGLSL